MTGRYICSFQPTVGRRRALWILRDDSVILTPLVYRSSIIAQLSEGVTLICDRYAFSGVSFSASKGLDYDWCAAPDVGLPAPDTVIFLDISPDQARLRGGYGEERYEREEIQRKVRETFKRMGDKEHESGRWTEIDAGREREVVAHDIFEIVHKTLLTSKDDVGKLWERIH